MAESREEASKRRTSLVEDLNYLQSLDKASNQLKSPAKKKVKKKQESKEVKSKDVSKGPGAENDSTQLNESEEFLYNWQTCACGMDHPPVPHFTPPDGKRCTYYWQLADAFPFLSLFRTLTTEIKFIQADADHSGLIELLELKTLMKEVFQTEGMSDKMIEKTFKEIDQDNSGTIDFFEVLSAVFALIQRDPTNLPLVMQRNYTKVCSIQ